jgi:biopolymer transport protein ExbD
MAFGSGLDDDSGESIMSEINMIPLVDIMLVLLIIFMITVPVMTHTVRVDLPRASNERNDIQPETVTIAVNADGQIHWGQTPVDEIELGRRLAEAAAADPQPHLHLRGDRRVDYEHVVRVMAAAQRAGVMKLGFITTPAD